MRRFSKFCWAFILLWVVLAPSRKVLAQELVREALSTFPNDTIRLEYSHPAVLRSLPDYSALRQRYEGPRLREMESSFSQLGIQESDVDELVLGWRVVNEQWDFFGMTSGHFDKSALEAHAVSMNLARVDLGESRAYCLGSEATANCLVLLENSLGAFGPLNSLRAMLQARSRELPAIGSDIGFGALMKGTDANSPIWGVAKGAAVSDWFQGWLPNQEGMKLDWNQAFKGVDGLTYSVKPGNTVKLNVRMTCQTSNEASSLKLVLDGLKMFQQMTWQNQNPNLPNPYQGLSIQANDTQVLVELETPYNALRASRSPGSL
jgi:hypothetical protein